jgi:predicted metalloprotease
MKFDDSDRADESEVEDRRGQRGGGGFGFPGGRVGAGVGGLGLVGTLVYVALQMLTGQNPGPLLDDPGGGSPPGYPAPADNPSLAGSCRGVTSQSDPAKFIVCVESNVQGFWRRELPRLGTQYHPSKLVLFTEVTPGGCGTASAETGPFYCPADKKVYLDLGFFRELSSRFGARGGDFAQAYVVAHEYGHHVQDVLGTERKVRALQARAPSERNALSVRMELQADCYAGVWGHAAYAGGKVSRSEIADALDAAAAVGDDRIQSRMRGRVDRETFTHGSAAERQQWFQRGMQSGDPATCDTFSRSGAI